MSSRFTTMGRFAFSIAAIALTAGCASNTVQPLYGWEGYQPLVYEHLKSTGNVAPEKQLATLEEAQQKMAQRGHALPPGYRAHMGMLYAKAGQADQSAEAIAAEKAHFPESATFMDFLLRTLTAKADK